LGAEQGSTRNQKHTLARRAWFGVGQCQTAVLLSMLLRVTMSQILEAPEGQEANMSFH
jgi:hypothetical protein